MIRKIVLQAGVPTLLVFIAWNAYVAIHHLSSVHSAADLTRESPAAQAELSNVLKDLTDMETGQRGYLLTGKPEYLQPYDEGKGRIATDFARLRIRLSNGSEHEKSLESHLESLTASK